MLRASTAGLDGVPAPRAVPEAVDQNGAGRGHAHRGARFSAKAVRPSTWSGCGRSPALVPGLHGEERLERDLAAARAGERGVLRSQSQVVRERQSEACADGGAVDCGDDRLGHVDDRLSDRVVGAGHCFVGVVELLDRRKVVTDAERAPRTGEDDGTDSRSAATSRSAPISLHRVSRSSAFSLSGRDNVTVATAPSRVTSTALKRRRPDRRTRRRGESCCALPPAASSPARRRESRRAPCCRAAAGSRSGSRGSARPRR